MKKLVVMLSILFLLIACKSETKSEKQDGNTEKVTKQEIAYASFGDKITDENTISKTEAITIYKNLKVGDTVTLKMETKINSVCKEKGCWMRIDLEDDEVMVKFKDYGFFMPKNSADKEVIVNGKAFISEVSVEEQKHYAEDAGKSEDEIAAITKVKKTLSFEADGVLLKE